jgi:hypothetical protein
MALQTEPIVLALPEIPRDDPVESGPAPAQVVNLVKLPIGTLAQRSGHLGT